MTLPTAAEPVPFIIDGHGVARVGGTHVTLDVLLGFYNQGHTAERLHEGFPHVPIAEIHAAICYYLRHTPEVDAYLEEGQREADELRRRIEADSNAAEWKAELKRRWAERNAPAAR